MENTIIDEELYKIKLYTLTELSYKVCTNFDHFKSAIEIIVPALFMLRVVSHRTYLDFYQAIKSMEAYLMGNHEDGIVDLYNKSISLEKNST